MTKCTENIRAMGNIQITADIFDLKLLFFFFYLFLSHAKWVLSLYSKILHLLLFLYSFLASQLLSLQQKNRTRERAVKKELQLEHCQGDFVIHP